MDLKTWHQEMRALYTAFVAADHLVSAAAEAKAEAGKLRDQRRTELGKADAAVREVEERIVETDGADIEALRAEHDAAVAARATAETALAEASAALGERSKEHKSARNGRTEAEARLQAFRLGRPYQPDLPGTAEAAAPKAIEVVAPKEPEIRAALRKSESLAAAAQVLGLKTSELQKLVAARGIPVGDILGADLPKPEPRLPPRRMSKRGGATA